MKSYDIIVIGTGLAGASAAATFGELGYNVKVFTYHDSARRAHSIAAQGGINAAKNYPNDGDSVYRLFYDTVKGGDYRSRESNVYRLAQVSNEISCVERFGPRSPLRVCCRNLPEFRSCRVLYRGQFILTRPVTDFS